MTTIIVGVDDSPRSEDAVALAGDLARAGDGQILAVGAFPFDDRPEAHFNPAMREPLRDERFDAAAKNGASARVQQRTAAAEMIRASVTNRVDNGGPGASVAIHGRRRSERSRAVLLTVARSRRE